MIKERYVEDPVLYATELKSPDPAHLSVVVGCRKITRRDGKPLTFYMDRVWAVRQMLLMITAEWTEKLLVD